MTKIRAFIEGLYAIAREFLRDIRAWLYIRSLRRKSAPWFAFERRAPPAHTPKITPRATDGIRRPMTPYEIKAYADAARLGGHDTPQSWRGKDRR